MLKKGYAKINLALDVVRRREDGYHELDMIMVPIALYDELDITVNDYDELICNNAELKCDNSNTIFKAINIIRNKYHIDTCFRVELTKHIPMQAGLAGGSADGAAAIEALDELCNLKLDLETKLAIGKQVGADVPFCIVSRSSRVKGIGEIITSIEINQQINLLLVKPKEGVSTQKAFTSLDFNNCIHPDIEKISDNIKNNKPFYHLLDNTLERVAIEITPVIEEIKNTLETYHFDKVLMSGSGSCVFAIGNDEIINQAYEDLKDKYEFVAKTYVGH